MRHLKRQLLITCFFCCMSLSCYLFFVDNKHIGHRLPPDELPLRALKITENTEENTKVDNVTSSVFSSSKNISDSKKSNDTSVEVKPLPIAVYPNCTIKKSLSNMRLFTNRFKEDYPPFLSPGFMKWDVQMSQYPPPFGMKTAGDIAERILKENTDFGLPIETQNRDGCRRCIIVGSGGILKNKGHGRVIDEYDVVIRMNVSPVKGYEKDVGTKTTIRITYPEGAPRKNNLYDVDALLGIVVFKLADLNWLDSVLHRKTPSTKGFWSKIAMSVPKNPRQTRIINPLIIREASFDLLGYPTNLGKMNKNVPTSGTISIMLALRLCDEVDVVGFGYNTKEPEALIHYYEKVKMKIITSLFTHDINHETAFLKKLVEFGVIRDLTGGLS